MATTLSDLENILDGQELSYYTNSKKTAVILPIPMGEELVSVFVNIQESGEFIMFRIPFFVSAGRAANRGLLFEKLLALNNKLKLGRFGLDPRDGEVCLEIGLPVEDGQLTVRQLRRTVAALRGITRDHREEMRKLIETGVDPDQQVEECVRKLLGDAQSEDNQRSNEA